MQHERILREMIEEADRSKKADASREVLLDGLFTRKEWPTPPPAPYPRLNRKTDRRSDFVIAALGITLGLICALFPWYIFFNQDQFGVQGIKFGGRGSNSGRMVVGQQLGANFPVADQDASKLGLDLFATGTLKDQAESVDDAPGIDQQPFPGADQFNLVHVANGRAMIEDDAGLWLVQRGSVLPDSSRVASIEQRGGKWVIVTDAGKVVEISR